MAKKMRKFASAGSIGRKATKTAMTGVNDILKSAPALVASAQSDKSAENALKAAVAPKKAPSFGEAFKAARAAGDKTFTWGGKSYAAKMAGEGAQKATPKAAAPAASPTNTRAQMELRRTATRSQAAIREKRAENQADFRKRVQSGNIKPDAAKATGSSTGTRDNTAAGRRERMGKVFSALNPFGYADNQKFAESQKKKGYAKGGSVAPQPTAAERAASKAQDERLKKARVSPAEARVIGSANRSEGGGKKKGGMIMKKATKAGKAMVKKSADTMGRAMVKKAGGGKCYAKGGSIDGIAKKGKTKGKMC
jgi:hypothetical protein